MRSEIVLNLRRSLENDNLDRLIARLRNGTGSRKGCLASLGRHAEKRALVAWFEAHDVVAARQWFREAAALLRQSYKTETTTLEPFGHALKLWLALVSNDEELIGWFARFEGNYDAERVKDRRTFDFLAYQNILALRGDWAVLQARCEAVIADPPESKALQNYMVDQHVHLALARGDGAGLQAAMRQLLDPALVRSRSADEGGYTEGLIFTPAVIYAKLAWRRGIQLVMDSPWVPSEWLPLDPAPPMASPYGV